jgi:hypothetical protein
VNFEGCSFVVYSISYLYPAPQLGVGTQDTRIAVDNQASSANSTSGKQLFKAEISPRESISEAMASVNV